MMLNAHDEQVLAHIDAIAQLKSDLRKGRTTLSDRDKARIKSRLVKLYGAVLGAREAITLTERR